MRKGAHFRLLLLCLGILLGLHAQAQFFTPTIDGSIGANEYGSHINGQNQETSTSTLWYLTWDANNLYLAYTGSNITEAGVLYLDFNPILPVNGGTDADGSIQGFYTYDRNHTMQPFRADFVLYFKDIYHEYRHADGAGYWGAQTANSLALALNPGTQTIEVAIPWNAVTNGNGKPAAFNWFAYKVYDQGPAVNGVYHPVPTSNPTCACNADPSILYPPYYYSVISTTAALSTPPFSLWSLTYYEDNSGIGGGYYLNNGSFYDITINDNSTDNLDNATVNDVYNNLGPANRLLVEGNIDIGHNLYIGQGSALLPADNPTAQVLATLTFNGLDGSIFNYGRLDPNPEASNLNDWNNRRIDLVIEGNTTIQASEIFKDRFRISNLTVRPGAVLQGPPADSASIEMQWGTLDNMGTILFGGSTGGHIDLGTRGDWSQQNDYYFNSTLGTGTWQVHGILIGRNSSRLAPVSGGAQVRLQVFGDFENYDEFLPIDNGGQIDVVMKGSKRQFFRGNTTETTNATTTFYNLEIDNDAGLILTNDLADVHFESFGGGTITYYVNGQLTLLNGDLVTRDRATNIIHDLILRDSATVDPSGARGNTPLGFSCFIDGPMQYEIESATQVTRIFPVGKSLQVGGANLLGDYRRIDLQVDHDAATKTIYTGEMFLQDISTLYSWPSPIPEVILWISQQRYWNMTKSAGANVQNAQISLYYDIDERNDGVNAPGGLRIVKDDGAGNWINITPLGPGGTATGTGNITSQPFTTFSDFTLASIINGQPLPVTLADFQARKVGEPILLTWQTASEINLRHFEVQRSIDQTNWSSIGTVPGFGNTTDPQSYRMQDPDWPQKATQIYYRLKMVDLDGSHTYSEIRVVQPDWSSNLLVWPNPGTGNFFIETGERTNAQLYDLKGKLIWEEDAATGSFHIQENLARGVYLLRLRNASGIYSEKLIVQ